MSTGEWVSLGVAFLLLEGSIFAAWMNLRDRVTRLEPTSIRVAHLEEECDDMRKTVSKNTIAVGVHEQRHKATESRLRKMEAG